MWEGMPSDSPPVFGFDLGFVLCVMLVRLNSQRSIGQHTMIVRRIALPGVSTTALVGTSVSLAVSSLALASAVGLGLRNSRVPVALFIGLSSTSTRSIELPHGGAVHDPHGVGAGRSEVLGGGLPVDLLVLVEVR